MQSRLVKNIAYTGIILFFFLMTVQNLVKAYFDNELLFIGYILGVAILLFLFIYNIAKKVPVPITTLDWIIFAYIIVQAIYIIPSLMEFPRGALMGFMYNVRNFFFPYFIIRLAFLSRGERKWVIRWMAFLVFIISVYGIYQFYFDWGRLIRLSPEIWGYFYSAGKRAYSFLFTPLDLAYSTMLMGLMLFSFMLAKDRIFSWFSRVAYFVIFSFCLFLTFTRSAYLGMLAGILAIIIFYLINLGFSWRILLVVIVIVLLLLGVFWWQFPDTVNRVLRLEDPSAIFHYENFKEGLKIFADNPLGIGLGRSGWTVVKWQAGEGTFYESALMQIMVETGILGIGLFVLILIKILVMNINGFFRSGKGICLGVAGATVGLFLGSFFLPVFYFSTVMSFYWGLVAVSVLDQQEEGQPGDRYARYVKTS